MEAELQAIIDVNAAYYAAFEARDLDEMSKCWDHSDRATCTHPGWGTVRGWGRISGSYFALFQNPNPMQFVITQLNADMEEGVGWVSLDENLLGSQGGITFAVLNLFVRREDGWKLICHHGSLVAGNMPIS